MKRRLMPLEIVFSVILICLIIFLITLISLEMKSYSQEINKKIEASIIASNILENMQNRSYDDIEKYIAGLSYMGISKKLENNIQYITVYGDEFTEKIFGTEIPNDYIVELQAENYGKKFNIIKKVSITVEYEVNNEPENFAISTLIERENISECNLPVISDEYFKEFGITKENYEIIPIKYSDMHKAYIKTSEEDFEWYNYSAKKWAKVIIFSNKESYLDAFINKDGTINSSISYDDNLLNLEDYMYVWIPNFSIKENITYFRYGTGKSAIKHDFMYIDGKYLYLNKIGEDIKDISKECSFEGIQGVWKKLGDEQDIYYSNFNQTKYAPINIY